MENKRNNQTPIDFKFPHVRYMNSFANYNPSRVYKKCVHGDTHLIRGKVYEFRWVSFAENPGDKRRDLLVTSDEVGKYSRLEENLQNWTRSKADSSVGYHLPTTYHQIQRKNILTKFSSLSCFIYIFVCPFDATYDDNLHIVLSCPNQ